MYICADCPREGCKTGKEEDMPKVCPTREKDILKTVEELYDEEENRKIANSAAQVEAEGYCQLTRLEETMLFFNKCNYKKIGVAFCSGLKTEMKQLKKVLEYHDFEVVSVMCKNGGIPKSRIGITDEYTIAGTDEEIMCNPIGQATFLNKADVDFNILFGLCVGHDSLVNKYLEKPVTTLISKDRVLGHNPIAAIYQSESYYEKKIFPKKK